MGGQEDSGTDPRAPWVSAPPAPGLVKIALRRRRQKALWDPGTLHVRIPVPLSPAVSRAGPAPPLHNRHTFR